MALQAALAELDHEDEQKHDEELDLHADKIIFQKLCYAVQTNRCSEEVAMLCMALEMVYRASRSRLALSFSEIRESLLPLAVDMLAKPPHILREEAEDEKETQDSRRPRNREGRARDYEYEGKHDDYNSADGDRSRFDKDSHDNWTDDMRSNFEPRSVMSGSSSAFSKRKNPLASVHSHYYEEGSVASSNFVKGPAIAAKKGHTAAVTVVSTQASSSYDDMPFHDGVPSIANSWGKQSGSPALREKWDQGSVARSFYDDESAVGSSFGNKRQERYNDDVSKDDTDNHSSFHHSSYEVDEESEVNSQRNKQRTIDGGSLVSGMQSHQSAMQPRANNDYYDQGSIVSGPARSYVIGLRDENHDQGSIVSGPEQRTMTRSQDDYYDQGSIISGPAQSLSRSAYDYHHQESILSGPGQRRSPESQGEDIGQGSALNGMDDYYDQGSPSRSNVAGVQENYRGEGSILSGPSRTVSQEQSDGQESLVQNTAGSIDDYCDQGDIVNGPVGNPEIGSQDDHQDQSSLFSGPLRSSGAGSLNHDGNAGGPRDDYQNQDSIVSDPAQSFTKRSRNDYDNGRGSHAHEATAGSRSDDFDEESIVSGLARRGNNVSRDEYHDQGSIVIGPVSGMPTESQNEFYDQQSIISGPPRHIAAEIQEGDRGSIVSGFARRAGSPDDFHGQGSILSGPVQSIASRSREDYYGQTSVISGPSRSSANRSREGDCDQGSIVSGPSRINASRSRDDAFGQGSVMSVPSRNTASGSRDYHDQGSVVSGPDESIASRSRDDCHDSAARQNDDASELASSYRNDYNDTMAEGDSSLDLTQYTETYEGDDQNPRVRHPRIKGITNLETIGEASQEESSRVSSRVDSRHDKEAFSSISRSLRAQKEAAERQTMLENRKFFKEEWEMIRTEPATHPDGVGRLLLILRYLSRVLSAMVPMAEHPGLLEALIYQLECQPYNRDMNESELAPWRIDAIATIVNLACAEENKGTILEEKGLLDVVMRVAQYDPSEEAREHAAIVFMNLAYSDENKERMVEHRGLLDTLTLLVRDDHEFTRRYATAALFTLACVASNSERMIRHGDGEVLEVLRRVLESDPVDEARINASEAIFNIARNNSEASAQILASHPDLLTTVAEAVLTDCTADARLYCARALEWLAADLHHPMESHEPFLAALTLASQWTKTNCIAEAMKTQALVAENRIYMAQHPGLLDALGNLAMLKGYSFADVRSSALAALELLSRDYESRVWMIRNSTVMQALTKATFELDANGEPLTAQEHVNINLIKEALKNLTSAM